MSAWLETARQTAAASNAALAVPSLNDEHWRFTSLRGIDFDRYAVSAQATAGDVAGAILAEGDHAGRIVMRDGGVVVDELAADVAAQGVVFGSLARLADEHAALIEPILGTIVGYDEKFAAENGALWTDGLLLHVPAGVKVQLPFHAAYELATPEAAQQWRVVVSLGEGAEATLVEEHLPGQPGYANGVAELVLAETSHLTYVVVQDRDDAALHFAAHRAEVAKDATLEWSACSIGAKTGKTRMETRLTGEGATGRLSAVYVVDGKRHLDLDTTQEHDAPNAVSDLAFKGVLLDDARSVWRGVIRVAEGAQGTDAYQENRNLLLSSTARADSIPGLEIDTNDVRCTHGATAGPVDPMLRFYLMSRGIPRAEAERMIVEGFLEEALERIPDLRIREALTTAVMRRVPD
ncbi:MAG: Fe-S cluster assembly protein SufD [Gaiellales bacterium]